MCNLSFVIAAKLDCFKSGALEPSSVVGLMASDIACSTYLVHVKAASMPSDKQRTRSWCRSRSEVGWSCQHFQNHYTDVIMSAIVYLTVYSAADQRKHQSSTSLAFVRWIHRWPMNSPHKGPVTRKMFPFDDVIMFRMRAGTKHWLLLPQVSDHELWITGVRFQIVM